MCERGKGEWLKIFIRINLIINSRRIGYESKRREDLRISCLSLVKE